MRWLTCVHLHIYVLFRCACLSRVCTVLGGSRSIARHSTGFRRSIPLAKTNQRPDVRSTESTVSHLTWVGAGRPGLDRCGCAAAAPATAEGGGRAAGCSGAARGRPGPGDPISARSVIGSWSGCPALPRLDPPMTATVSRYRPSWGSSRPAGGWGGGRPTRRWPPAA